MYAHKHFFSLKSVAVFLYSCFLPVSRCFRLWLLLSLSLSLYLSLFYPSQYVCRSPSFQSGVCVCTFLLVNSADRLGLLLLSFELLHLSVVAHFVFEFFLVLLFFLGAFYLLFLLFRFFSLSCVCFINLLLLPLSFVLLFDIFACLTCFEYFFFYHILFLFLSFHPFIVWLIFCVLFSISTYFSCISCYFRCFNIFRFGISIGIGISALFHRFDSVLFRPVQLNSVWLNLVWFDSALGLFLLFFWRQLKRSLYHCAKVNACACPLLIWPSLPQLTK